MLLPGAKRGDGVVADEVTVDNGAEAGVEVEEFPAAPQHGLAGIDKGFGAEFPQFI